MSPDLLQYFDQFQVPQSVRSYVTAPAEMFIDGRFTDGHADRRAAVVEPATEAPLTTLPLGTTGDVDAAVRAARRAFDEGPWPKMPPNERQRIILRLAELVERDADFLAMVETIDNGKAIGPCRDYDILGSADLLRYMAGWATKIEGATRQISGGSDYFSFTLKEPIGVVGAITPWNWPLNMAIWKIAAPLAAGCTIVMKPAELTSLSILHFARLCQEAGLPEGVFNVVTGKGAEIGSHLAAHPGVDKVSFTGSTRIGQEVGQAAMSHFAPVTLELGGKSPMVAFADCDLDALVQATRNSIFFNAGQNCSAGSRLYLHRSIYEEGLEAIRAVISQLRVAPGLDPACDVGPVISARAKRSIEGFMEMGRASARTVFGGRPHQGKGYFVEPTLFALEDNAAPLVQEEIFGPILVALPFDTEDEAIRLANDNQYGLGAYVFTRDLARAHRMARALRSGSVWVNCFDILDPAMPFGGVKASGFGKDLGREQIEHYLQTKSVTLGGIGAR